MIRINLLPVRAARKKENLKNQLYIFLFSLVLVLVGLFFVDSSNKSKIRQLNAEIKKNEAEIDRLKAIIGEVGKLKARKKSLEDKTKVIEKLKSGRNAPVRMMDEFSNVIPQKAWINSFSENGSSITINCEAVNEEVISDFMITLEKSDYFDDVRLTQITNTGGGRKAFGLSARLSNPPETVLPKASSAAPAPAPGATGSEGGE